MNNLNLPVVENGLIPIYKNDSINYADARELHAFLEVGKDFSTWIKDKIEKYGFVEGDDYSPILGIIQGRGQPKIEYALTIDTAKEIAMVENNEKGRLIRKYFIEVEKRARQPKVMSQTEIIAAMAQNQVELERTANMALQIANKANNKIDQAIEIFSAPIERDWKHETNSKIRKICQDNQLSYIVFFREIYDELEECARVRLASRQSRLKSRMKQGGATYKDRQEVSKLDVISRDPQLRMVFDGLVRKYQTHYAR